MNLSFKTYCGIIRHIRETGSSNGKIKILARLFSSIGDEKTLALAAQFIGEGAFEEISGKRAAVGSRTSGLAAAKFCEIDYDLVFKPCRTATGSNPETIARLMANIPEAVAKRTPKNLSLVQVQQIFEQLSAVSGRTGKEAVLWEAWGKMTPPEIRYFTRMLGRGSLRIGLETRSVVASIAAAFDEDREKVRYAHMITGSLGKTAVLAKQGRLDDARFRLFHPLPFMLASPIESGTTENVADYIAEEKFDGMRAQVHANGSDIKIFSRNLNDITRLFPDVVSFFAGRNVQPSVFDGQICACKDGTIRAFQLLQKRLEIKKPGRKILAACPVLFIAYDILFTDGNPVFNLSLVKRRALLETAAQKYNLPVTNQFSVGNSDEAGMLFRRSLERGNDGLMLKLKQSNYEYGQRGTSWLKIKKPGGTLKTVIMYAHEGSGERSGTYSDFTLGISVKRDERYEEEFIPIGKANGGYTDGELNKIHQKIKELTAERYGPTLGLIPRLVVEIEFDDIRMNKRTKAGYTLQLPRFRAIRWDLGPADVNTLKDVEQLFQQKLTKEIDKQKNNPSYFFKQHK